MIKIGIELTTSCELDCHHCTRNNSQHQRINITTELINQIARFIRSEPRKINLSGGFGDPFLYPGLKQAVALFSSEGHEVSLYTSPHHLVEGSILEELCNNGLAKVSISLDRWHLESLNGIGWCCNPSSLQYALRQLAGKYPALRLEAYLVLNDRTFEEDFRLLRPYLQGFKYSRITIQWAFPFANHSGIRLAEERVLAMAEIEGLRPLLTQRPSRTGQCFQLKNHIFINSDGYFRICCVQRNWTLPSRVSDYECLEDFMTSVEYIAGRESVEMNENELCRSCPLFGDY